MAIFSCQTVYIMLKLFYKLMGSDFLSVKIVHCGDLHLGAELSLLGEKAPKRRAELLQTFANICEYCKSINADFLLIAGDFFDSHRVSAETVNTVKICLWDLENTKVFIVAGNHDFLTAGSPFDSDWGENVHIFYEDGMVETENARIYGLSFRSAYSETPTLPTATPDGKANILLLHADLDGGPYSPITPSLLAKTRMDYVALGHVHSFSGILSEGATRYAYCGSPEPLGYDEIGEKGVIAGDIENGSAKLSFIKLCRREYKKIIVNTENFTDSSELIAHLKNTLSDEKDNFLRIILSGECSYNPDIAFITAQLEDVAFDVRVKNHTRPAENLELLKNEQTLKGIFTDRLLSLAENSDGEEKEAALYALRLGLAAFDGREIGPDEN